MRVFIRRCDIAPASDRWQATAQEYDLDVPVGCGPTPLKAIEDLFWHLDIEDVDPASTPIIWEN